MNRPSVLFDVDGTLLFLRGLGRAAMERAMEEVWGIPNALEGVFFGGATDGGVARRVAPRMPRKPMWRRYEEILRGLIEAGGGFEPLPGVVALLDALRGRGVRMGLLTGNIQAGARLKLQAVGLLERFDSSLSAFAEDGDRREQIAEAARRRCGETLLAIVGDAIADVRCARHVGARVLCVATGLHSRAELESERPDLVLDDLTATDAIVDWLLSPP